MADPELQEMWHVGLGTAQCVCIALLPTIIGMYAYLGTRTTRYYQGLARTFKNLFLPNWICPHIYVAWMATMGFIFWLTAFAADCNTLKYGFDLNPWTNFFFILWTLPMGLRLAFFSGRQWRGLLLTTDIVAIVLAITHFIMAVINMPDQPELVCGALIPEIMPLSSIGKVIFYVAWGVTIAGLFVITLRDLAILLKPLQSFIPIDYWLKYWYESEAECQELCPEMTKCYIRDMEEKYDGFASAIELIRESQRKERIAVVKAKMASNKKAGISSVEGAGDDSEAGLVAGVTGGTDTDPLDTFDQDDDAASINSNAWLDRAAAYKRKNQDGRWQ